MLLTLSWYVSIFISVFPFVWMVISALKPKTEIRTATPTFMIHAPTLENFQRVFDAGFLECLEVCLYP